MDKKERKKKERKKNIEKENVIPKENRGKIYGTNVEIERISEDVSLWKSWKEKKKLNKE